MAQYRATFEDKQLQSVERAKTDEEVRTDMAEENTGSTLYATIEASSDEEAQQKAERLQVELQTGKTKREITGGGEGEE